MADKVLDADGIDSDNVTPKVTSTDSSTLASELADARARQAGLNKTVDKYKKQLDEKEAQVTRLAEAHETEAAELRRKFAEAEVAARTAKEELAAIADAKTKAESRLLALEQREQVRAKVATTHPGLLGVLDDLKGRGEFDSDETFTAYLDRMQTTLYKSSAAYATGGVPPAQRPASSPNQNGAERSVREIEADLWDIRFSSRENQQRLNDELEAAMKRQRIK